MNSTTIFPVKAHASPPAGPGKRRALLPSLLAAALLVAPASVLSQSPPPQEAVNLRSTANFAVLAASLVSNIPTSAITGDIGLSPATGGNITGFGTLEVTGTIYTVDASGPAGSVPDADRLTTAQGDLTLAYNDAAERTPVPSGPFLNPDNGSGNIGGQTLVPGLYKFTSAVSIAGSDLTLAGGATDIWIFQIASDLTVGNGIQVILSGGARAANVFWQVGSSAMLGTTSVFKGTILADQSVSLNTGASIEGRALARIAAVTLSSNTVSQPGAATTTSLRAGSGSGQEIIFHNRADGNLEFTVPADGPAKLILYSLQGRQVAVLFDGMAVADRRHASETGTLDLQRGMYFTRMEYNGNTRVEKVLLNR